MSEPRSRRDRPAKAPLSRAGIVAAAMRVLRADGLAKVTMRRLAQELDTGPASLYVYFAHTAALHAAMLDEVLGTVALARGPWRQRVEEDLLGYTLALFEHPQLAQSAVTTRPSGPHYLNLVNALLGALAEGGVPAPQAAWGVDVLLQVATANAAEHSARQSAGTTRRDLDDLAAALGTASPADHPHIAAVSDHLLSGSPRDRLRWGYRALVNGIAHTPPPGDSP
ncbi:AcrR family transcriptional regulator [Crossiella equi]|uniref:AcrR family transcriptional regulator n=1 Tax=Crossiella equi TaxID=130796 RepID=A0ABS5A786_9PSEU|nr:TetR/AcrR family transcriptional regulator [Crossiella equi]MBP2472421.1 AcrR family transcriptional regulator [Crossiella equi]